MSDSDARERSCAIIIVNADDWGRSVRTTDRTLECVLRGAVSSVSAMAFMEDSERAAGLARLHGVDAGLHLNFTLPYSAPQCSRRLMEHQEKISRFLSSHRLAPVLYHPGLANSFEYVVKAQFEEYERLYDAPANRVDGHHHMHLCTNVAVQALLPRGIIVRRNLSFWPGEKGPLNRFYRSRQDQRLARSYRISDFFFDLAPLEPRNRLAAILQLAARFDVEVETHPVRDEEYKFLADGELIRIVGEASVSPNYILRFGGCGAAVGNVPCAQQAWR